MCALFSVCTIRADSGNIDLFVNFNLLFSVRVYLIYNALLVSGSLESGLVIRIHVSILFRLFSHIVSYRILNRVLYDMQ